VNLAKPSRHPSWRTLSRQRKGIHSEVSATTRDFKKVYEIVDPTFSNNGYQWVQK